MGRRGEERKERYTPIPKKKRQGNPSNGEELSLRSALLSMARCLADWLRRGALNNEDSGLKFYPLLSLPRQRSFRPICMNQSTLKVILLSHLLYFLLKARVYLIKGTCVIDQCNKSTKK